MKPVSYAFTAAGVLALAGAMGYAPSPASPARTSELATGQRVYRVDSVHSSIVFKVGYLGVANFYGRFNDMHGKFSLDFDEPAQSMLDIRVVAGSVDTNEAERDKQLRGESFFSSKEFPEIRFKGEQFRSIDGKHMDVQGSLTMRGVHKPAHVTLTWIGDRADPLGGYRGGWETLLTIQRSDFGVNYGLQDGVLSDEIGVIVAISGLNQK